VFAVHDFRGGVLEVAGLFRQLAVHPLELRRLPDVRLHQGAAQRAFRDSLGGGRDTRRHALDLPQLLAARLHRLRAAERPLDLLREELLHELRRNGSGMPFIVISDRTIDSPWTRFTAFRYAISPSGPAAWIA
jgi:hypothetical protein